jgi:hypothetical protein
VRPELPQEGVAFAGTGTGSGSGTTAELHRPDERREPLAHFMGRLGRRRRTEERFERFADDRRPFHARGAGAMAELPREFPRQSEAELFIHIFNCNANALQLQYKRQTTNDKR